MPVGPKIAEPYVLMMILSETNDSRRAVVWLLLNFGSKQIDILLIFTVAVNLFMSFAE